ncbi:MAG TPA: glycosyltransferase family 39 protein, partial [Bryobacteraceae bacterium]|nr:glycosyltransferase family 39 protein [Bryobacteraceae bacterium]
MKSLRIKMYRGEEVFLGFVLGAACLSAIIFLLSVAHLAYTSVFLATGCAIVLTALLSGALRLGEPRPEAVPRWWMILFIALYVPFACFYFITALGPEASPDGAMYHVALPALYLREHHIPAITTSMLAALSEGAEMLYLFAFSLGRHSATAMIHLSFLLIAPWGMLSYARRIGSPAAGVIGGLLFFLSPAVGMDGTMAYVDVALATVIFAVFYLLEIWRESQDRRVLLTAGLLAGFSYAIKYTAGIALPYALGVVLLHRGRAWKVRWRECLMLAVPAVALMAPWIVKDAVVFSNPVAPFANRVFSNPYLYASTEAIYARTMGSLSGMPARRWPYDITTRGTVTQGFIGPVFLLAPLALLALWLPAGRRILAAAAVFSMLGFAATGARFLFPALTFVSLALGLVLARWRYAAIGVIILHAVSAVPTVMPRYASRAGPRLQWPDWRAALRLTPESQYLRSRVDGYGVGQLMDAKLAPDERVFSFQAFQNAYHSRQVLVEWQSALGVRLGESLRSAIDPDFQPSRRYEFSFAPITARKVRLVQSARDQASQWSVSELRFFHGGKEYGRAPGWRLHASPNPWDVQLAFDNSLLTRWASRQPSSPGMYIEVDFGEAKSIDQVTADCTLDQAPRMEVQFESGPG